MELKRRYLADGNLDIANFRLKPARRDGDRIRPGRQQVKAVGAVFVRFRLLPISLGIVLEGDLCVRNHGGAGVSDCPSDVAGYLVLRFQSSRTEREYDDEREKHGEESLRYHIQPPKF